MTLNLRAIEVTEDVSRLLETQACKTRSRQACEHESDFDSEAPIKENNETALCVAIHYLNHAHPFCGQYFSFTPSTVVAPQARTHRAVMTFPLEDQYEKPNTKN